MELIDAAPVMRPLFVPLCRFSGRVDCPIMVSSCRCGATTAFSFSYNSTYTAVGLGKDDHRVISLRGAFSSGDEEGQDILVASIVIAAVLSLKLRPISGGLRITTRTDRRSMNPISIFFEAWHADWLQQGWE